MSSSTDWKVITKIVNPRFKCKCGSKKIKYRIHESSDGGHEDINYKCLECNHSWWVDGIDS